MAKSSTRIYRPSVQSPIPGQRYNLGIISLETVFKAMRLDEISYGVNINFNNKEGT